MKANNVWGGMNTVQFIMYTDVSDRCDDVAEIMMRVALVMLTMMILNTWLHIPFRAFFCSFSVSDDFFLISWRARLYSVGRSILQGL